MCRPSEICLVEQHPIKIERVKTCNCDSSQIAIEATRNADIVVFALQQPRASNKAIPSCLSNNAGVVCEARHRK